jgi:NAD(P)-dependent dehydrogenase (short-subunit alcohol dehydrogenase family)
MASMRSVQPASRAQRANSSRAWRSSSVSASRQTPPLGVAPIPASVIRLAHRRWLSMRTDVEVATGASMARLRKGRGPGDVGKTFSPQPALCWPVTREGETMFQHDLMQGQRILVTGGGTGLGRAMAERFLSLGADVAICGRRKAVCDETAAAWRQQFPGRRIDTFGVDIRIAQAVEEMVESLWQTGGLTGLVNNAAGNFIAPTESLSPRAFDAIANIVFHGSFYVTQAVGKRWVAEAKAGAWTRGKPFRSVMSIITTWVDNGSPYVVPSAMSKAGIDVMTKSLAVEWAQVRRAPERRRAGRDPDRRHEQAPEPRREPGARSRENNPMARPGEMRELQNLATFLMAPGQCDWLTGQSIMMDGGSALATGGNFYELRSWSDADWQQARARIEAQNQKDKAQR